MFLKRIKKERVRGAAKKPFEPTLFDRVGAVVRACGLGRGFLEELEASVRNPSAKRTGLERTRRKSAPQPVLFSLLTKGEYRVTVGIIERLNNPYLAYANDPGEILLSETLFNINPDLKPELLAEIHFEAIIQHELGHRDLNAPGAGAGGDTASAEDRSEGNSERVKLVEKWIDDLETLLK